MRPAADFLPKIQRRSRQRLFIRQRFMDEQPQAAWALQTGHVAGLGEMHGHEHTCVDDTRNGPALLIAQWKNTAGSSGYVRF
jgi:hypothetical protein